MRREWAHEQRAGRTDVYYTDGEKERALPLTMLRIYDPGLNWGKRERRERKRSSSGRIFPSGINSLTYFIFPFSFRAVLPCFSTFNTIMEIKVQICVSFTKFFSIVRNTKWLLSFSILRFILYFPCYWSHRLKKICSQNILHCNEGKRVFSDVICDMHLRIYCNASASPPKWNSVESHTSPLLHVLISIAPKPLEPFHSLVHCVHAWSIHLQSRLRDWANSFFPPLSVWQRHNRMNQRERRTWMGGYPDVTNITLIPCYCRASILPDFECPESPSFVDDKGKVKISPVRSTLFHPIIRNRCFYSLSSPLFLPPFEAKNL